MKPTLRSYRAGDFEALMAIERACYPPGIVYSRRMLRLFLSAAGADCIVAKTGREIAGFILTEAEGPLGHIITIDVLEPFRRSGIGTALLRAAEQRLAARGIREVALETATDNHAAIAFWQKHGYRTRGTYERYYLGRVDALVMRKEFAPAKEI